MHINKELKKQMQEDLDSFMRIETCSARDCTSLIASKAIDEDQAEAYDEIYNYNPANYYDADKIKQRGK